MRWSFSSTKGKKALGERRFKRHPLSFEALEPRLLLSADAFGGLFDADDIADPTPLVSGYDKIREDLQAKMHLSLSSDLILSKDSENPANNTVSTQDPRLTPSSILDLAEITQLFTADSAPDTPSTETARVFVIDTGLPDWRLLLEGAELTSSDALITITPGEDGLTRVTQELAQMTDASSMHIFAHATPGTLDLGSTQLNFELMQQEDIQEQLQRWQNAFASDADLFIYGCDFAANDAGLASLQLLADLTQMDMAASDDLTGGITLGGNWQLEVALGEIDASQLYQPSSATAWEHSLATIVVNTNEDQSLGFGINNVTQLIASESEISLREALQAITREPAFGATQHRIIFDLGADNTIALNSVLPTISRSLIMDGGTAADGTPGVRLTGFPTLLNITADDSEIRGLEIFGGANGIVISGNGNLIAGNYIHDNSGVGIEILGGSNNILGGLDSADRNLIVGNGDRGIKIGGSAGFGGFGGVTNTHYANDNQVLGNWIGLGNDGLTDHGNGADGIYLYSGANATEIHNNVISGNDSNGILIEVTSTLASDNHVISSNIVGLDATASVAVGNAETGIIILNGADIQIGQGTTETRNIISANGFHGIEIQGADADSIRILGNYLGTDGGGTVALGNTYNGIEIYSGPVPTGWNGSLSLYGRIEIGGLDPGQGNLISGNLGYGIKMESGAGGVNIFGNQIGTDISGQLNLGNNLSGILIDWGSTTSGFKAEIDIQHNTIAYNLGNGIEIENDAVRAIWITDNIIFDNAEIGIDLGSDGFTANDAADFDSGPNLRLNYPVIRSLSIVDDQLTISGSMQYGSNVGSTITLQFFYSDHQNAVGGANAQTFIGERTYSTNYSGSLSFDLTFDLDIASNSFITAITTTDAGSSEMAPAVLLAQGNIANSPATGEVTITGTPVQGAILTAVPIIADSNGRTSELQYQWRRNGIDIAGANGEEYTLVEDDVDRNITVAVSFVDDDGYSESLLSGASDTIANINDAATGTVKITGNRVENATLSVVDLIDDPDGKPSSVNIQWFRDGIAVTDATGLNYLLTDADVGTQISAVISYVDLHGTSESISSELTSTIVNVNDSATGTLTLDGIPAEDNTLSAIYDVDDEDGKPPLFQVQWYRDGALVTGATNDTYTLTDADVGTQLSYSVSFQDLRGANEILYSGSSATISNTNDAPIGTLDIVGSNVEGATLQAQVNFTDADEISGVINYQWYRDGVDIVGATAATYLISNADVNAQLTVRASYQDDFGNDETVLSSPTNRVNNTNQAPTGSVSISGSAIEDQLLSVDISLDDADGEPSFYDYHWYRDDVPIIGADQATLLLTDEDVGKAITVEVSYIDGLGSAESVISLATSDVINVNDAPSGTVKIIGSNIEGHILTAQNNISDADGRPSSFNYQWYRDGAAITGANGTTYQLGAEDVDKTLTVQVSYVDLHGSNETVLSADFGPILNVNQSPDGPLLITGNTQEGSTLYAEINFTDDDALPDISSYLYQWYRDGVAITGAINDNYTLTQRDVDSAISVSIEYQDLMGTDESVTSDNTAPISNVNDVPTGTLHILGGGTEGQRLTLTDTIKDEDGIAVRLGYQWYRDGVAISDAISDQYLLQSDDIGQQISVRWQYLDQYDTLETVQSQSIGPIANANSTPTGQVQINGIATENEMLTVTNSIIDEDGTTGATFNYQWYRDGQVIAGATSDTLLLDDADVNATIHVIATYTDDYGTEEIVASSGFGPITSVNDQPGGSFTLTGNPQEDSILTLVDAITDADDISNGISYQWYRDNLLIAGANGSTLQLDDIDVGSTIHAVATYVDGQGTQETLVSNTLGQISPVNDPPTGALTLVGEAIEDQTLSFIDSVADVDVISGPRQIQWYRDDVAIVGATGMTYTLNGSDIGSQITVSMSYIDDQNNAENVVSAPTIAVAMINHPIQGYVTISGIPLVGNTLVAQDSPTDADILISTPLVQWFRDGELIVGATSASYTLTAEDQGHQFSVQFQYVDARGYQEVLKSDQVVVGSAPTSEDMNLQPDANTLDTTKNAMVDTAEDRELEDKTGEPTSDADTEAEDVDPGEVAARPTADERINTTIDRYQPLSKQNDADSLILRYRLIDSTATAREIVAPVDLLWKQLAPSTLTNSLGDINNMIRILGNAQYTDRLDTSIDQHHDNSITLTTTLLGGTTAVSTGLSIGYLAWTLRSGILMTSLLSSLPAWRFIDPLPILESENKSREDDDESLQSMVESSSRTNTDPRESPNV